jgi:NAD(P)-dependent dehydrogenase (short-subunit alcohol dehydrogenase family)
MTGGASTAEVVDEEILECFTTGALGSLHVMQACFEHLCRCGNGVVINFGSGVAVRGAPKMAAYAMAKEAIGGLSKVAAQEWGRFNIRVNVVCPSAYSPAAQEYRERHPQVWEKLIKETPLRRMGDPDTDIARAVMALATDDFCYLTGATLMLDGGKLIMR